MLSYLRSSRDILLTGFVNVLAAIKQIALLSLITKLLGVESYGIWTQAMVTAALITPFASLGLPYALNRFLPAEHKQAARENVYSALSVVALALIIITAAMFLFTGPIAGFLRIPTHFIAILAAILVFETLNYMAFKLFITFREIVKYSLFMGLYIAGELLLVWLAIRQGWGIQGALTAYLAARIVMFAVLWLFLVKKIGIAFPAFKRTKEHFKFGISLLFSDIFYWVLVSSDRYLLGFFLGVLAVGYYSPGYAIGNILHFLIYPFAIVLPPIFAKLFDEHKMDELRHYYRYSMKYLLAILIPSAFGLSVLSKKLLAVFSTEEIAQQSYPIVAIIALALVFYGMYAILSQTLALYKKTNFIANIWAAAAIVNFLLNIIFIPRFGLIAAGINTLLAYLVAFVVTAYYAGKLLEFHTDIAGLMKILSASSLMTLFVYWIDPTALWQIILAVIASAMFYFILLFLLRFFQERELNLFKKVLFKQP